MISIIGKDLSREKYRDPNPTAQLTAGHAYTISPRKFMVSNWNAL